MCTKPSIINDRSAGLLDASMRPCAKVLSCSLLLCFGFGLSPLVPVVGILPLPSGSQKSRVSKAQSRFRWRSEEGGTELKYRAGATPATCIRKMARWCAGNVLCPASLAHGSRRRQQYTARRGYSRRKQTKSSFMSATADYYWYVVAVAGSGAFSGAKPITGSWHAFSSLGRNRRTPALCQSPFFVPYYPSLHFWCATVGLFLPSPPCTPTRHTTHTFICSTRYSSINSSIIYTTRITGDHS